MLRPNGNLIAGRERRSDDCVAYYRLLRWQIAGTISTPEADRLLALRFESEGRVLHALAGENHIELQRAIFSIDAIKRETLEI